MERNRLLENLKSKKTWDVLVIGGGASGLAVALEAANSGYETLLLEARDIGSETSSASTKLLHGGIRYLKSFEIPSLLESSREQRIISENFPHITDTVPFFIPSKNLLSLMWYKMGLTTFDLLTYKNKTGSSKLLLYKDLIKNIPNLNKGNFKYGNLYYDMQFDDSRLALNIAREIISMDGVVITYMPVISLLKSKDKVCGVTAKDTFSGEEYEINSKVVINATGPFSDRIRRMDKPDSDSIILPMQGTHVVLPNKFLGQNTALMIPKTRKNRVLYAIPWFGRVLVGTTEKILPDDFTESQPSAEEINYLLEEISEYLENKPTKKDILSVFSGIRPLLKPDEISNKHLSRDHRIELSESDLISLAGGKWTTFRIMGKDTLKKIIDSGLLPIKTPLSSEVNTVNSVINLNETSHLRQYGIDAIKIKKLENEKPNLSEYISPSLPTTWSMVHWAIKHEMSHTIEDILARRTRSLFLDANATIKIAPEVAKYMAKENGQSENWVQNQIKTFNITAEKFICHE